MGDKLTKSDLQAIRSIVRCEIRRSAFSKLCSIMKFVLVVLSALATAYCMLMLADKFMGNEEEEEIEETE